MTNPVQVGEGASVGQSVSLACGEVRGGNEPVHTPVNLPGLRGTLYSSTCDGSRGGDVHYLSVCGSGLLARLCLADVAGHGDTVSKVGAHMYDQLRRSVDIVDDRRVLGDLDRRLTDADLGAVTTAALVTYYPPSGRLTFGYAGHPPGWLYRRGDRQWMRLDAEPAGRPPTGAVDLPLGTGLGSAYTRRRLSIASGDRLLIVTDGVLEAPDSRDEPFDVAGVERVLQEGIDASYQGLGDRLLQALLEHCGRDRLVHDDVTFFVGEFVPGPPGPVLWHVVRNRILRRVVPSYGQ